MFAGYVLLSSPLFYTGGEPGEKPHLLWVLQLPRPAASDQDPAEHPGLCPRQHHLPHHQAGEGRGGDQRFLF